jgi:hypothetical protein
VCSDLRDAAAYDAGAQIFFCNDFDQGPEDPYVIDGGASAQRVGGRWASAPYSLAVSGPGVARFALASSPASWAIEVDVWLDGSLPAGTAFAMVTDSIAFSTVTFVTAPGGVGLRGLSAATFLVPPGWVHLRVETQPTTPTNTTTVYVDGQPFVLPLPIISSPSLFLGTPEAGAPVYYDDAVGKRAN